MSLLSYLLNRLYRLRHLLFVIQYLLKLRPLFVGLKIDVEDVGGCKVIENMVLQDVLVEVYLVMQVLSEVGTLHGELKITIPYRHFTKMRLDVLGKHQ